MKAGGEPQDLHGRRRQRPGSGLRRARHIIALALLFGGGCQARGAEPPGTTIAIEGLLAVAYGDPTPPAEQGSTVAMLLDNQGRSYRVLPDTAAGLRESVLGGFSGGRVRITGTLRGDSLVIWARTIERLPERRQ